MFEQIEVNSERWFDLTPLKNEEFRDIENFEGLYQISNYGRVKSLERFKRNHTKVQKVEEQILKSHLNNRGYYYAMLNKEGEQNHKTIHRLIAQAFIPNPNNLPCINHIDGNKLNNSLDNMEFCTYSHNNKEAYRLGLKKSAITGRLGYDNWNSKPICQYDLKGNFIKEWACSLEVKRQLGINASNITSCCRGERNKAGGYIWKYRKEQ